MFDHPQGDCTEPG